MRRPDENEKIEINLDGQQFLKGIENAIFECDIHKTKREEILTKAKEIVTGEREEQYGSPEDNFSLIAEMWSKYLDASILAEDVAVMMILMKIARIKGGGSLDCWVDIAGYAACGGEIFENINE